MRRPQSGPNHFVKISVSSFDWRRRKYIGRVINTDEKLAALLTTIRSADWLALDTEADSLHAYPEKVCLIQISTAAGDTLIDPLAGITLDPLLERGRCPRS